MLQSVLQLIRCHLGRSGLSKPDYSQHGYLMVFGLIRSLVCLIENDTPLTRLDTCEFSLLPLDPFRFLHFDNSSSISSSSLTPVRSKYCGK
jgi:hypothetical protein